MSRIDIGPQVQDAQVWQFGIELPRCIERSDCRNIPALFHFHLAIRQWENTKGCGVAQDEWNIYIVIRQVRKALLNFFEEFLKGSRIWNPDFQHILFA